MSTLRNALRDLPGPVFADLLESEAEYLLIVDLSGVNEDTVELDIDGPRVRIEARREKDLPREYRYLQEDRPLFLDADLLVPPDASGPGASATIDRGRLELRLPKREHEDTTSVPITVNDRTDAPATSGTLDPDDGTDADDIGAGGADADDGGVTDASDAGDGGTDDDRSGPTDDA